MDLSDVMCIRKWGGSASDAILDPTSSIFRISEVDGIIGYRASNRCAIVFGDPVCPPDKLDTLIKAFVEFCAKARLKIVYLIVSEEFAMWLLHNNYAKTLIEYGEEFVLDPHDDPRKKQGPSARLVRRKVGHALKEGVSVKEYIPYDAQIEKGIIEVGEKWLAMRKGPQIHFAEVSSLDHPEGKRWLYAEKDGQIIGSVILSRLERHEGYLLNQLMFTDNIPAGVPELLVVVALEILAAEGCHHVNFGTVPLSQLGKIIGLGRISKRLVKSAYHFANKIYHLNGKKVFWEKFGPISKKEFLVFHDSYISLKEALALKKALNADFKGILHVFKKKV